LPKLPPPLAQPASKLVNNNDATIKLPFCDVFMMYFPLVNIRTFLLVYSQRTCQQKNLEIKGKITSSFTFPKKIKPYKSITKQ